MYETQETMSVKKAQNSSSLIHWDVRRKRKHSQFFATIAYISVFQPWQLSSPSPIQHGILLPAQLPIADWGILELKSACFQAPKAQKHWHISKMYSSNQTFGVGFLTSFNSKDIGLKTLEREQSYLGF